MRPRHGVVSASGYPTFGGHDAGRIATVALANPLGAGLAHYTESLEHVLRTCGVATDRVDVVEPSSADYGKIRWLCDYLYRVRRRISQGSPDALVAAWPAIGYWDLSVLTMLGRRRPVYVVMHDPHPLVYARGYGSVAKALARRVHRGAFVAHSSDAASVIVDDAGMPRVFEALHPMLAPKQAPLSTTACRSVRVLGQYKVDRDSTVLSQLAADAPSDWRLEIVGRGWPPIDGWQITSEFVPEADFDRLIRTSDAVVIPYSHFYQSGVAIRALEWGVPVVGPCESSLTVVLGSDCSWLVRDGDWHLAVAAALREDRAHVAARASNLYDRVIADWAKLLKELGLVD